MACPVAACPSAVRSGRMQGERTHFGSKLSATKRACVLHVKCLEHTLRRGVYSATAPLLFSGRWLMRARHPCAPRAQSTRCCSGFTLKSIDVIVPTASLFVSSLAAPSSCQSPAASDRARSNPNPDASAVSFARLRTSAPSRRNDAASAFAGRRLARFVVVCVVVELRSGIRRTQGRPTVSSLQRMHTTGSKTVVQIQSLWAAETSFSWTGSASTSVATLSIETRGVTPASLSSSPSSEAGSPRNFRSASSSVHVGACQSLPTAVFADDVILPGASRRWLYGVFAVSAARCDLSARGEDARCEHGSGGSAPERSTGVKRSSQH